MPNIPIGRWVEDVINWLIAHFSGLFDGIANLIEHAVDGVLTVLIAPHQFVMIAILALLALAVSRSIGLVVFTVVAFLLIDGMGMWLATMQTLTMIIVAVLVAVAIGLPTGILAGLNGAVSAAVRPVLDLMQTLPVFVYLIPAVFFFGIGVVPGVVATIVFAIAPAVRLTELGIRQVDPELVEAVQAFGAKRSQVLREVQLPMAYPSIMAGVNQVIMLALSMVVVAGLVGASGLGPVVVRGVGQLDVAVGFEGGLSVVVLAIYLDRVTGAAARHLQAGPRNPSKLLGRWRRSTGAQDLATAA